MFAGTPSSINDSTPKPFTEHMPHPNGSSKIEEQLTPKYLETGQEENEENFDRLKQRENSHLDDNLRENTNAEVGRERVKRGVKMDACESLDEMDRQPISNEKINEPIWFDVWDPVELFTGRNQELLDLKIKFEKDLSTKVIAIIGCGGMGKTQLARKYIKDNLSQDYHNVIWINADNEATTNDSFTRLAKFKLNIVPEEKKIENVIKNVQEFFENRTSVFIFDNAENDSYLERLVSIFSKSNNILITSQNEEWDAEIIDLKEFSLEDAMKYAKTRLYINDDGSHDDDEMTKLLVEKLLYFPLAIQQATAYIAQKWNVSDGNYSIDDYLKDYNEKTQDLLNSEMYERFDNNYTKAALTTWKLAVDYIVSRNDDYEWLALRLITVIAFLNPLRVTQEVISEHEEWFSPRKAEDWFSPWKPIADAVKLLVRFSLLHVEKPNVLTIDRLVQKFIMLEIQIKCETEAVLKVTLSLLNMNLTLHRKGSVEYNRIKMEYLQCLGRVLSFIDNNWKTCQGKSEAIIFREVLMELNWKYDSVGEYKKVKEVLEILLQVEEKLYRKDDVRVAATLFNLGNAYGHLCNHAKKIVLKEKALSIRNNYYGPRQINVAASLFDLATDYGELGDHEKQKEMLTIALMIQEEFYGENHIRTAATLHNLGIAYGALGSASLQKELQDKAQKIRERNDESEHIDPYGPRHNPGLPPILIMAAVCYCT